MWQRDTLTKCPKGGKALHTVPFPHTGVFVDKGYASLCAFRCNLDCSLLSKLAPCGLDVVCLCTHKKEGGRGDMEDEVGWPAILLHKGNIPESRAAGVIR